MGAAAVSQEEPLTLSLLLILLVVCRHLLGEPRGKLRGEIFAGERRAVPRGPSLPGPSFLQGTWRGGELPARCSAPAAAGGPQRVQQSGGDTRQGVGVCLQRKGAPCAGRGRRLPGGRGVWHWAWRRRRPWARRPRGTLLGAQWVLGVRRDSSQGRGTRALWGLLAGTRAPVGMGRAVQGRRAACGHHRVRGARGGREPSVPRAGALAARVRGRQVGSAGTGRRARGHPDGLGCPAGGGVQRPRPRVTLRRGRRSRWGSFSCFPHKHK